MLTLKLSSDDVSLILSALSAVSPSGGGSEPFTLFRRIARETGIDENQNLTGSFCCHIVADFLDSCESDDAQPRETLEHFRAAFFAALE